MVEILSSKLFFYLTPCLQASSLIAVLHTCDSQQMLQFAMIRAQVTKFSSALQQRLTKVRVVLHFCSFLPFQIHPFKSTATIILPNMSSKYTAICPSEHVHLNKLLLHSYVLFLH